LEDRNEDGAVLPAVTGEIGLRVALDIEFAHHSPSINWRLPDRGSDSFSVPCHVAWKADICREESGHAHLAEIQLVV
jgi:hypothetical protein